MTMDMKTCYRWRVTGGQPWNPTSAKTGQIWGTRLSLPIEISLIFLFTVRRGRSRLLRFVFDSFDWVAKNLFQAHGRGTVGLAEVFVDLIPVIHPRSGKAD